VQNQLNCIEHRPMTTGQGTWVNSRHASDAWLNSRRGINVHSVGWERKV